MRRSLLIAAIPLLAAMAETARGQEEDVLTTLHRSFRARCEEAGEVRDGQLRQLDDAYSAALQRQVEKSKSSGQLGAVLPFIDEIEALKKGNPPAPTPDAPAELRNMRAKHDEGRRKILETHARAVTGLADKMDAALVRQESSLTKAGDIATALEAKRMRESLSADPDLAAARDLLDIGSRSSGVPGIRWIPLATMPHQIAHHGQQFSGLLIDEKNEGKGNRYPPFINQLMSRATGAQKKEVIAMFAPSEIQFRPAQHVVEFRGKAFLGLDGDVTFRVKAGGKIVAEKVMKAGTGEPVVDITCKFPPTRLLTLEVDANGDDRGDCSAWLEAEAR